jgi:membrane protein YqaA with SNARE-associated domain
MSEQWIQLGYFGFFLASFLAATVVPFSTEVMAVLMVTRGFAAPILVLTGAVGGYLGCLVNYYMAKYGGKLAFSRFFRVEQSRLERVRRGYARWGSPLLFFSWLPVIGEAITMAGGLLGIPLPVYSFWVLFGRAARLAVLLWIVGG